ncbi:acetyl-CoA synthetase-like protein [Violaceomyces palustris]|uniref:Acetyl-CoA synthetase-like protein n=1 Tax=Violaceomyces palustris TaxID=1673888 RepID=A0ACD0NMJ4_9BASI|nr:acetyl-CoA synthetase-like protein [Violaceomyces palustris]
MTSEFPLGFLYSLPPRPKVKSLGDHIAEHVTDNGRITTLIDCLSSTSNPAIWSPDLARPPLDHRTIKQFIQNFVLPTSGRHTKALGPNDRVMMALPTGPENALALLSVAAYHTCAPVNASCTAGELRDDAVRLRAKAVVTTRDAVDRLELYSLYEDEGMEIIFVENRHSGPAGLFDMSVLGQEGAVSSQGRRPSPPHGLEHQSLVLHTSGTSGKKKVVPYSLRHLIVGTCCVVQSWDLRPESVNMNMMPLFHVGGIVRNLWAPMFSGGSAIMCAGFDANAWWPLAKQLGATWYYAAPTMHHAILASKPEGVDASKETSIKMIANAAGGLLPSLAVQLKETFGNCAVLPSYGMTECMPIASPPTNYQLDRPGCSGVACGPDLSIRDPFNREKELPVGQTGAVSVRGLPTFSGYEVSTDPFEPLDTSAFSSEGWFDSGDMGHMDADGYLYITGRSKEIINKGGEVVSPFEVEEAISQACKERVKQCLAFSIEHTVLQETIGVVIVPVPNQPRIGLSELQNMLRSHLHPSKWPFAAVYMDDLPKNQAGKPLRIKLGTRLNIGPLSDDVPPLQRHFEAKAPGKEVPLSEPIPCNLVSVDVRAVERACYRIPGIIEAAVRQRKDGSPEAFIQVEEDADYDAADIDRALAQVLHGYVVPNPLHVFRQPLAKINGQIDFQTMEDEVRRQNASGMSRTAIIVRDIIAKLLDTESGTITAESDFFLLGGNSLLLGRLVHLLRKETGVSLEVSTLFNNSTVAGIASLIEDEQGEDEDDFDLMDGFSDEKGASGNTSFTGAHRYDDDEEPAFASHGYKPRSQSHPWVMLVQAIPLVFFYPLKAAWTWTVILHGLAFSAYYIRDAFWERVGALLASILVARFTSRIICPVTAIAFKWLVIGRYRPGKYPMWCNYHLRWWIVNQSLKTAGKGLFALTPGLQKVYYRLLGMSIGSDVKIDPHAKLGEYDLITLHDGARIDKCLLRGFCVERDGYFRLEPIIVGRDCVVNTFTQISPGARLADGTVWGPQSSSHEEPSSDAYAAYNRTSAPQPHWALITFIGYPILFVVRVICYVPWFAALFMLLSQPFEFNHHDSVKGVIAWFAYPRRVGWHYVARIVRNGMPPLINLVLGILIKRILGLNREGSMRNATQFALFRRWMNQQLLSQAQIRRALAVLGTHYEMTSVIYRAMGAKVGKRVYWPGSAIYCPDPELLEIGDDVVFGSRSEVFTSDSIGWARVRVGRGAMIADRVVLLPGTTIGKQCVMGSGALARRNGHYEEGTVWMGSKHGEAVSFGKASKDTKEGVNNDEEETITPFGRAFYKRKANYFVFPYLMLVAINVAMTIFSSGYWATAAVGTVLILNYLRQHFEYSSAGSIFDDHWYRPGLVYAFIAVAFIVILVLQALLAFAWTIGTKWAIIGRRREGRFDWDKSSYCQRWQLHLTLQRLLGRGFGGHVLGNISGSIYAVWYLRALGAKIGKECAIWAGGKPSLQLTEPELVTMGDYVSIDDCSVVAHINSRGRFSLNKLRIGDGCAMRTGSRLLSGASMEPRSMLLEHTLVASGEIAEAGAVYAGWPARQLRTRRPQKIGSPGEMSAGSSTVNLGGGVPPGYYGK